MYLAEFQITKQTQEKKLEGKMGSSWAGEF